MGLFMKEADVWKKGSRKQVKKLINKLVEKGEYKELLSHYNKGILDYGNHNGFRMVELSRDDVFDIIRKLDTLGKKIDFIARGGYVAKSNPFNSRSIETQQRYYQEEHEFADFVMKQLPDEKLWAELLTRLPTDYSDHNGTRVVTEASTLSFDLLKNIQSEELMDSLRRYDQFKNYRKPEPVPEKKQPQTQEEWIQVAMEHPNIYTRMDAASHIKEISLIPEIQKERCAQGNHLWVDDGSTRQQFQYGMSVDRRKCIYCGKEYCQVDYGD